MGRIMPIEDYDVHYDCKLRLEQVEQQLHDAETAYRRQVAEIEGEKDVLLTALKTIRAYRDCTDECETRACDNCGEHVGWPKDSTEPTICQGCVIKSAIAYVEKV